MSIWRKNSADRGIGRQDREKRRRDHRPHARRTSSGSSNPNVNKINNVDSDGANYRHLMGEMHVYFFRHAVWKWLWQKTYRVRCSQTEKTKLRRCCTLLCQLLLCRAACRLLLCTAICYEERFQTMRTPILQAHKGWLIEWFDKTLQASFSLFLKTQFTGVVQFVFWLRMIATPVGVLHPEEFGPRVFGEGTISKLRIVWGQNRGAQNLGPFLVPFTKVGCRAFYRFGFLDSLRILTTMTKIVLFNLFLRWKFFWKNLFFVKIIRFPVFQGCFFPRIGSEKSPVTMEQTTMVKFTFEQFWKCFFK